MIHYDDCIDYYSCTMINYDRYSPTLCSTILIGQVWLELAMALETVDRGDEARQLYGKLATVSW